MIYKKITVTSKQKKVQISVLQGSFDEILLINIFINNLCLPVFLTFLSNYADDNSLFIMVSPKATLLKVSKQRLIGSMETS